MYSHRESIGVTGSVHDWVFLGYWLVSMNFPLRKSLDPGGLYLPVEHTSFVSRWLEKSEDKTEPAVEPRWKAPSSSMPHILKMVGYYVLEIDKFS